MGTLAKAVLAALTVFGTVSAVPAHADEPIGESIRLTGDDHYAAVVRRTEYGIPHVLGADLGSAGYGYGYAFAQDNLCVLADQIMTLSAQRSRYGGPDAVVVSVGGSAKNIDSDIYYQAMNDSGAVEKLLAAPAPLGPSAEARALVSGYVAGYNRYLRETGVDKLPDPTCRGKDWVRPITDLDIWRNLHDINQLGGLSSFVTPIATGVPPTGDEQAAVPRPSVHESIGSNAWGLGGDATRDGHGMVLANPHFPWTGTTRFYQVQLTVPGRLNVTGASIYGSPMVELGHNADLAWSHTVSTAQRYTLFQLALKPGEPTTYLVDGKPEPMTTRQVRVPSTDADGNPSTVERTVYGSRFGTVLAQGWTGTTAFAVRGAGQGNLRDVDEWLGLGRSRTVAELGAVQRKHQSMPFVNTIAADSAGDAYYADASVVPNVTDEHAARCVDTPEGKAVYPKQTILDGARSDCDWGTDPAAIEPGIFGPDTAPRQLRRDYVANSNESPWLTNATAPLTGYPRIYGEPAGERSLRDRLSHQLIAERGAGFDLDSMQAAMLGNRNLSGELSRDAVVEMCRANPTLTATDGTAITLGGACDALAGWNLRADSDSAGSVLWREFWLSAMEADDVYLVPFDVAHPVTTPNTFNQASPGARAALADAVQRFTELGLPLDLPLGAVQRFESTPVQGGPGGEGVFNIAVTGAPMLGDDSRYPDVVFGSSFIMAAQLTPAGPRARTIMTYSLSANPASPHHKDQTELYAHKGWVTDRFTFAEITAGATGKAMTLRG